VGPSHEEQIKNVAKTCETRTNRKKGCNLFHEAKTPQFGKLTKSVIFNNKLKGNYYLFRDVSSRFWLISLTLGRGETFNWNYLGAGIRVSFDNGITPKSIPKQVSAMSAVHF
jgi:hypothetical protein